MISTHTIKRVWRPEIDLGSSNKWLPAAEEKLKVNMFHGISFNSLHIIFHLCK
jgi:hypothetical protein